MVDIVARLKIRAEEFSRGADTAFGRFEQQASQAGNRAGDEFARGLSARLDALSAGAGVAAVVAVGQRALEHVTTLKKESEQLGISTKALQEYRFAASEVGVEQADLSDGFTDLTQKIGEARGGSKEAMQGFRDLGIDLDDTTGRAKTMETVFNELIGRLSMVSDPTERARLEAQLFGEEWRKIDPMLRAGSGRIDQLRTAAHQFGAVISDDAIQNADATARKVAQMKLVLEANIADAVARNSTAILGLANSLTKMAGGLAQWWSQNPEEAYSLMGAAGGARIGAFFGAHGAAIGAGVGYVAGAVQGKAEKQAADDANMDLRFRQAQLHKAQAELAAMKKAASSSSVVSFRSSDHDRSGGTVAQADAELRRQSTLAWRAAQAALAKPSGAARTTSANAPSLNQKGNAGASGGSATSGGKSNGKSDTERDTEKQIEAENRLRESLQETIQSQRDSVQVAALRAQGLERQADLQQAMLEIQRQFPGLEGTTNAKAAEQLGIREEQVAPLREQYELLKAIRTAEVNRDNDAAEVKARVETERKAQEEIQRLRDAADERQRRSVEDLSRYYYDLFSGHGGDIWRDFKREGMDVISVLAAQWTIAMITGQKFDPATALGSAGMGSYGGPATTLATALFSGRGSSLADLVAKEGGDADQIKSAVEMSKSLGSTSKQLGSLNKMLAGVGAGQAVSGLASAVGIRQSGVGSGLGSAAGAAIGSVIPGVGTIIGGIAGGLLGGTIGGMLKKTKKGSASINIIDGEAAVGDAYGNSSSYRTNATALGGSVADQLNSIADMLGGDLTGTGAVSIGQRKKKFVVDTSGTRKTKGAGTLSFDTEEAAVEAAVRNMLQDGILGGVSAASQKILRDSSQTLEKALTKASLIEAIPDALQARLNPVQYALDQLNEKWDDTWDALKEGAATAEQMAQAQQLYNLELEEVKNTTAGAAQGLKDFIKSMDMGSSSPLSLRDQDKSAYDALSPYLSQISSGQSINQDAYMDAAQTWLDIQRQLYGSTAKYFESFDTIQSATAAAIADIESVTSISTASDAFNQKTASATAETAANTSNIAMLLQNGNADLGTKLDRILAALTTSGFVGERRNFAK